MLPTTAACCDEESIMFELLVESDVSILSWSSWPNMVP
jgi:hypothetical protein